MDPLIAFILVAAGALGGFVAGLVGVGGGVVFAPVLFFYFQSTGTVSELIAPTTVATSLLCTLAASSMSAWQHHRRASVDWRISLRVGLLSALALYLAVALVTTRSWYDRYAFELVFGLFLIAVAGRMFVAGSNEVDREEEAPPSPRRPSLPILGGIGSAAGAIAALAGVGGGIVMVPAFHQILRLPMRVSVGTSSGAIVMISLIGVAEYAISGWSLVHGPTMLGYVDVLHGLLLALPAIPGAQAGARVAHLLPKRQLQVAFAAIAVMVGVRMLISAFS